MNTSLYSEQLVEDSAERIHYYSGEVLSLTAHQRCLFSSY